MRHFCTQYCHKKDISGPWMSIGQGKLITKNQGMLTKNKSMYVLELTLVGH